MTSGGLVSGSCNRNRESVADGVSLSEATGRELTSERKIMSLVLHSRGRVDWPSRPLSLPERHGTNAAISVRQIGNISGLRFLPWAKD
jgi:hypothetical protein